MKTRIFGPTTAGAASALAIASTSTAFGALTVAVPPTDISTPLGVGAGAPITSWDINGDTVIDFQFVFRYYSISSWQALMSASPTSNVLGDPSFAPSALYARSYGSGVSIAPGNPAFSGPANSVIILGSLYAGNLYGGFAGGGNLNKPRFAGFRFNIGGQPHYGYLEMAVNANGSQGTIDFISAAYESTANTAITTGGGAVPEGKTLAALVTGGTVALALARRRHRQRQPATAV